jgi:hypothetical protein
MNFEETVRSLKVSDFIFAMVAGLSKPRIKIDMSCFGRVVKGKIEGCAATATIIQLYPSIETSIKSCAAQGLTTPFYPFEYEFISYFEDIFDHMRYGNVSGNIFANVNRKLSLLNFPYLQIPPSLEGKLPYLGDDYTKEQLELYTQLAEYNKSIGN